MTKAEFIQSLKEYFINLGVYEDEAACDQIVEHVIDFSLTLINKKNNGIHINTKNKNKKIDI